MRTSMACVIAGAMLLSPSGAAEAQSADEPQAAVDQFFLGMRIANERILERALARDARLAVLTPEGEITVEGLEGFIRAVVASGGAWNEQIYDTETRVDGDMASIWAPYTFYLSGRISHCGINSIELLRGAEGWKITQISDTRRTQECPDPLGGD